MTDLDFSADTIITDAHVRWLMDRGAYWLAEEYAGCTIAEAAKAAPWAVLEFAAENLPKDVLIQCAKAAPWAALEFAAKYLPKDVLIQCAKAEPWEALVHAAKYLPDDLAHELRAQIDE